MDINLKIDFPALDRIADAFLIHAAGAVASAKPKTEQAKPKDETKTAKPKADEGNVGTAASAGNNTTTSTTSPSDDAEKLYAEVKKAAAAAQAKNGRDALVQLIKDHGGTGGTSTIPADNHQAFIDAVAAL